MGQPMSGFVPSAIDYMVDARGLSNLDGTVDVIVSRAVLEHVNDLEASMVDMSRALRPEGQAIPLVDLKSHGMHRQNILDFLSWSPTLWNLMHSNKGVPNRIRVGRYREIVDRLAFTDVRFEATKTADLETIRSVRPQLALQFSELSDDELSWLGFWMSMRRGNLVATANT